MKFNQAKDIVKWTNIFKNRQQSLFDEWISNYHAVLYKHALWMTGNTEEAAEMVQETYYQAWSSMHSLENYEKALPWMLTILRRVVYREQRHQYRNQETIEQLENIDKLERTDRTYTLLEAYNLLEKLSYSQRETYLLSMLHGFTYAEISDQLNVPIGTVMSRIARAKEALNSMHKEIEKNVVQFQVKRNRVKK